MKKLFILLAMGSFSAVAVNAQTTTFGVKAGMTSANMKASGGGMSITFDSKIGFYAGFMAEIGVSENFAVQPELFYSAMGAKQEFEGYKMTENSNYLNLPILLKYKNQGFAAFVGPQISYLLSAKSKGDSESMDSKDNYKSTDFSGVIGAGYTLTSGLGFDARYQMGFANIAKDSDGEGTVKNNAFMVGLHYFFNR